MTEMTTGVRVLYWFGEDDLPIREVRGLDADAVRDRALDLKNGIDPNDGPYIHGEWRDVLSGEWVAVVRVRGAVTQ